MDIYNKALGTQVKIGDTVLPLTEFATAFQTLLIRHTANFENVHWLGVPIWQDILSLWTIQETIAEVQPSLIIETGTNRGGSAFFGGGPQLLDSFGPWIRCSVTGPGGP